MSSIDMDIVDYKRDIPKMIREYSISVLDIENPCNMTQLQFNSGLMYIYNRYIQYNLDVYIDDKRGIYNDQVLMDIYNIYVLVCSMFDKHMCINGYSYISGISKSSIYEWGSSKKASRTCRELYKNLINDSEESLQDLLVTGRRNPVGIVAILNNRHGWASQTIRNETTVRVESNDDIAGLLGVND